MATQIKNYPIVESAINLFGDWLRHQKEMRELREINDGDFTRIAQDLGFTPPNLIHSSAGARTRATNCRNF